MWDNSRADLVGLRDHLSNMNWKERLGEFRDIEFVASEWPKIILEAAKLVIPNKYVTIRPNDKPWYSNELRRYSDQLIGFIAWPMCVQMNIRGPDIHVGTAKMNIFRCVVNS